MDNFSNKGVIAGDSLHYVPSEKHSNTRMASVVAVFVMFFSSRLIFTYNVLYLYCIMFGVLILSFVILGHLSKHNRKVLFTVIFLSVVVWGVESYLMIFRNSGLVPFTPTEFVSIYSGVLLGYFFVFYPVNVRLIKTLMYCFALYFFVMVALFGVSVDDAAFSEKTSPVGLITMLFSVIIPVLYLEYRYNNKISILPVILLAIISLYVASRTGLVACVLLLLLIMAYYVLSMNNKGVRILLFLLIGILLSTVAFLVLLRASGFTGLEKLTDSGTDLSGREYIWAAYFWNFNINDLFFGRNIEGINDGVWQNAHNSWIQLHSSVGFIGVLLTLFVMWIICVFLKKELYLGLLLIVLIFYSFFNAVFFFQSYDYFLYIFLFEYLRLNKEGYKIRTPIRLSLV